MDNKIIFKTHAFPTVSETFVVSNIVETIKAGFDVEIIVDTINAPSQSSQPLLLEKYDLMNKVRSLAYPTGFKKYFQAFTLLFKPKLFYYFLQYCKLNSRISPIYIFTLNFYVRYRNAQRFHVHFANAIEPLFDLKRIGFLNSKLIVTMHGYDAHFKENDPRLDSLIPNFQEYVSKVTTNSSYLKEKIINYGFPKNKIIVVPIGIDSEHFEITDEFRKPSEEVFKIISIGRLFPLKGHHLGIEVIKLLKNKGLNVTYTIIGEGNERERLEALIEDLELEDSVFLVGQKSQAEIRTALAYHNLFLMTSTIDGKGRREAFGLVSLEAQAMGLPVVGFDSGGFPETIVEGETGFVVDDKDTNAMADLIARLARDTEMLEHMHTLAINHVQNNFNLDAMSQKYIELYRSLV